MERNDWYQQLVQLVQSAGCILQALCVTTQLNSIGFLWSGKTPGLPNVMTLGNDLEGEGEGVYQRWGTCKASYNSCNSWSDEDPTFSQHWLGSPFLLYHVMRLFLEMGLKYKKVKQIIGSERKWPRWPHTLGICHPQLLHLWCLSFLYISELYNCMKNHRDKGFTQMDIRENDIMRQ